jgi:hypothetical protein
MSEVPWEYAQDVMGGQGVVFIAFILRLMHRRAQDEIHAKPPEITGEIDRLPPGVAQSETDRERPYCEAPP